MDKLKNFPTVYYMNLDHRVDRREYMESQFDRWGITDYHRVSSSKYLSTEQDKWEHLVLDEEVKYGSPAVANSITHLEMIGNWLETTDDPYMVMMEDDYDLSLIEYWNFDWDYLMNNIPENWDCIQLGFENREIIPFFLHPPHYNHGFGPCLINRDYAKKLIKMHCVGNKFKLNIKYNDVRLRSIYGMVDVLILRGGNTYSIPLITNNPDLGSDYDDQGMSRDWHGPCRDLYYDWWKNEHHKFDLEDFFTFGKSNDFIMTKKVRWEDSKNSKIAFYS